MPFLINKGPKPLSHKVFGTRYEMPVGKAVEVHGDKRRRMLIAVGQATGADVQDFSPSSGPSPDELIDLAKREQAAEYAGRLADLEAKLAEKDSRIAGLRDELRKQPGAPAPARPAPPPAAEPAPKGRIGRPPKAA